MRIKIGDEWYDSKDGIPMMVCLSGSDEESYIARYPERYRHAAIPDDWDLEQIGLWMDKGWVEVESVNK